MQEKNKMTDRCPSTLSPSDGGYSAFALKNLFGGVRVSPYLDFEFEDVPEKVNEEKRASKISISGVQDKFPAVIENGRIRLARRDERSTHILKPIPSNRGLLDRHMIPANEHLTMQLASRIYNIRTAANGLCFTSDGKPVYITRRFDINDKGQKLIMEDFASLTGRFESEGNGAYKYDGSYLEIASLIRKNVVSWKLEIENFFRVLLFNYIYANGDAHLKNFSLIGDGSEYRLAPAYDLINTALHINDGDFALSEGLGIEKSDIYERTDHPAQEDFLNFGKIIGIKETRAKNIIAAFEEIPPSLTELLDKSFLSGKHSRSYLRVVRERMARLSRCDA